MDLLLRGAQQLGGLLFGEGAFGDPAETARAYAPGLLDDLTEEQQAAYGRQIQSYLRNPWISRGQVRGQFAEHAQQAYQERQRQRQYQQMLDNADWLNEQQRTLLRQVGPEQGLALLTSSETLSAGQGLVNPFTGAHIAAQPTTTSQEYQRALDTGFEGGMLDYQQQLRGGAEATAAGQARENRIQSNMRTFGVDRRTAEGMVDGYINIRTDPETGRMFTVDLVAGTQRPLRDSSASAPMPQGQASLPEGLDITATTGVAGGIRRAINTLADATVGRTPFRRTDEARIALENLRNDTTFSLAESLPGRVAQQALQWLREGFTVDPASILQGSESAERQLRTTRDWIDRAAQQQRAILENEFAYPVREVQDARRKLQDLENIKENYDVLLRALAQRRGGASRAPAAASGGDDIEALLNKYAPQ